MIVLPHEQDTDLAVSNARQDDLRRQNEHLRFLGKEMNTSGGSPPWTSRAGYMMPLDWTLIKDEPMRDDGGLGVLESLLPALTRRPSGVCSPSCAAVGWR